MKNNRRIPLLLSTALACAVTAFGTRAASAAPVITTLVSFNGTNGSGPVAGLTFDAAGNLYGTTQFGGAGSAEFGNGTAFELSGADLSTLTTLASFNGGNGTGPQGTLTLDSSGNLYGTTSSGGANGDGTVFELSGSNHSTLTTLASFTGSDGAAPYSGLTIVGDCLFGTTSAGGASADGTVFELCGAAHTTLTTLVSFTGTNGNLPYSTLVADSAGNLYGTTINGGADNSGTVFELSGADHKTLTTLVSFNGTNGSGPRGGLAIDASGQLYGTTEGGGSGQVGTIFELSGANHTTLNTLFSFSQSGPGGTSPEDGVLLDAAGNLYGTTSGGIDSSPDLLGSVFKLSADHQTLTTLYAFTGNNDGGNPVGGLTADSAGNLYGTTSAFGASGDGVVFKLSGSGFVTAQ